MFPLFKVLRRQFNFSAFRARLKKGILPSHLFNILNHGQNRTEKPLVFIAHILYFWVFKYLNLWVGMGA